MTSAAVVELLASHVLSIVGLGMGAVLIANVLGQRRTPQSTLAWLLAIVLIPYVGVPLYIVFGGRKLKRDAALKVPLYGPDEPAALPAADAGIAAMLTSSGARQGREPQVARTRLIRPTITITILLRPAHRPQCS